MKQGETGYLKISLDVKTSDVTEIIFSMKDVKNVVSVPYPSKVAYDNGKFLVPLYQADTLALRGKVSVEAQINYKDKSVQKTSIATIFIKDTLATKMVTGNTPSSSDTTEVELTVEPINALIETDKTLSISDRPADAKASGDRIRALESENAQLKELLKGMGYPINK